MKHKKIVKQSKTIKYRCDNCGHIETLTARELKKNNILKYIYSLIFAVGVISVLIMIIFGPTMFFSSIASSILTIRSNIDVDELRHFSINASRNCVDDFSAYSYCYAYSLYGELQSIRYVPASQYKTLQDPLETLMYGGDCKHMGMLFVSLMKSVGFNSYVICDSTHCVVKVPHIDNYKKVDNGFAIVDLTIPGFFIMSENTNPWDYMTEGVRY